DILYMRGIQGVQADTDRDKGVKEALADYPGIKLKEVWTGWDYTKGGEIAVQELTTKPYDAVWTSGTEYTAVNAIKTAGRTPVPVGGQESNEFVKQLAAGAPGVMVTNPAVIGGAALSVALRVAKGEDVERDFKITPKVFTSADKSQFQSMYVPGQDQTFNTTTSIDGLTHFTKDQLLACKGPGE
ncbi:substrate-binding domain-containing protein, partial [Streptomyces sp. NPDC001027]|uniref:substrate-binding domain-containing protein n=1 Tax=Streptomyces sp. NPDC001027 TaxID=3154771 RepID=UPI00331C2B1C